MWLLFAFSGPVFWAISTHIDKYLVDRYFRDSDTAVLMVFTALIGVVMLPVIWYFEPGLFRPRTIDILVMGFAGICYMGAMLFYLRAIQSEEASVVAPLFQTSTLFTFFLAFVFLHELPRAVALLGAGLIIVGALVLSLDMSFRFRRFKLRLVVLMLAATAVMSASSVLFKYFAVRDEFWVTTFWITAGQIVFGIGILLIPHYWRQFAQLFRKNPGAMLAVNGANELINLGGGLGVRYASLLAPVALVSAISSTTTLFVFAFGILLTLFFPKLGREKLTKGDLIQKGAGAILVTGGVVLINLGMPQS